MFENQPRKMCLILLNDITKAEDFCVACEA